MNQTGFEDLSGVIYSENTSQPKTYESDNSNVNHAWCNMVGYGNMATVHLKQDFKLDVSERNRIPKLCLCSDTPVDRSMAWTSQPNICNSQGQCQNLDWKAQTTGYTTYPNMRVGGSCKATTSTCSTRLNQLLNATQINVMNSIGNVNDGKAIQLSLLYAVPCRISWLQQIVRQEQSSQSVDNRLLKALQDSILQHYSKSDSQYYIRISQEIVRVCKENPIKGHQLLDNYIQLLKNTHKYTENDHSIIHHPTLNQYRTVSVSDQGCHIYERDGQYNLNTPGRTHMLEMIRDGTHFQMI
jgi:hypothetical protein